MPHKKMLSESDLALVAKEYRLKAGRKKKEAAKELGVGRATIQMAEENPEQSLTKLRIKIIEKYSPFTVIGPVYLLERK